MNRIRFVINAFDFTKLRNEINEKKNKLIHSRSLIRSFENILRERQKLSLNLLVSAFYIRYCQTILSVFNGLISFSLYLIKKSNSDFARI